MIKREQTPSSTNIHLTDDEREWMRGKYGTLRNAVTSMMEITESLYPIYEVLKEEVTMLFEWDEMQEMKKLMEGTEVKGSLRFNKELLLNLLDDARRGTIRKVRSLPKSYLAVLYMLLK